jgi:septal ring factor EnvC (AmiA/AmiB activator)
MVNGKHKNLTKRNQDHSPSSERSTPTSPSPGHLNTPENLDPDLKAYLMMIVDDIKDFNNSLKEIQENTAKELQVLKEKQQKRTKKVEVLKDKQESTSKQVMEMNKTILDLTWEVDTIKKTQSETTLEIENLEKKSGNKDASIRNRIRDGRENLRCRRFHREHWHNNQRKCKMKKDPNSKHPGNPGHNGKTKPKDNRSR